MNAIRYLFVAALAMGCGLAHAVDRDDAQMELAQATTAVQTAERDDAARYAPADFDEARAMLDTAQRAADSHEWTDVAIYAERAKVTGDLASARSRQHRAEAATAELQRSLDALHGELSAGGES
jgi:hypothetical protein